MSRRSDHPGAFERQVRQLVDGFVDAFPSTEQPVIFSGKEMTMVEVVRDLERMLDTFDAVHRAGHTYRQSLVDRRRSMKAHRSTYGDAVVFLKHQLGKDSPRLLRFGVRLPKPRQPLSSEASAIARAKAAATRKARGTLGRRQRQGLGKPPEPSVQVIGPNGKPLLEGAAELPASEEPEPVEPV